MKLLHCDEGAWEGDTSTDSQLGAERVEGEGGTEREGYNH
jgi:hypothetical protein